MGDERIPVMFIRATARVADGRLALVSQISAG
jgi:hypothetical protein